MTTEWSATTLPPPDEAGQVWYQSAPANRLPPPPQWATEVLGGWSLLMLVAWWALVYLAIRVVWADGSRRLAGR